LSVESFFTSDVEVGAAFESGPELSAVFAHAVLDIDLGALVAGERDVEAGQAALSA
jgi:hypothetical protein